jgi:hypothetical protein
MVKPSATGRLRLRLWQVQHHAQTEQHERQHVHLSIQRMAQFGIKHDGHLGKV